MRIFPDAKAALIIEIGRNGAWQLATSPYSAEEARRNVASKFPACAERLEALQCGRLADPDGGGFSRGPRAARLTPRHHIVTRRVLVQAARDVVPKTCSAIANSQEYP